MAGKHIDSFEVAGFRCFSKLRLEGLGHVNLITGQNSVGKTCLLEALELWTRRGVLGAVLRQLVARDDLLLKDGHLPESEERWLTALSGVFPGWPRSPELLDQRAEIAMTAQDRTIRCWLGGASPARTNGAPEPMAWWLDYGQSGYHTPLESYYGRSLETADARPNDDWVPSHLMRATGLDAATLARQWDEVALTDYAADVIAALKRIMPGVEALNFGDVGGAARRVGQVRLGGRQRPVPLASLGDGVTAMLGLALSLAAATGGLLLIDELSAGLHYSIQAEFCTFLIETARRFDVQVVATTHSWDCIAGFQAAVAADDACEGRLYRLDRVPGGLHVTTFAERELELVTKYAVEVR